MVELCPSCAMRDVPEDSKSGFCQRCETAHVIDGYIEKDRQASDGRRERWRERTEAQRTFERIRQQRHRTLVKVKPREPCPELPDPLILAQEALDDLETIKLAIKNAAQLERLERVAEALRRLAWGPDDEPAKQKAEPKSNGWDGSWRHVG